MTRKGLIKWLGESRTVSSQRTGEIMSFTPMEVSWYEEVPNSEPQLCNVVADVKGSLHLDAVRKAIENKTEVTLRLYFETREYQDRRFNNIKLYIDKDFFLF